MEEVRRLEGKAYSKMYYLYSDKVTEQALYDTTSGTAEVRQLR